MRSLVEGALTSLFNDTPWQRAHLSAHCDSREHHPEVVPDHACSCGIYAYYDPCPRTASAVTRDLVAGAVVMWGRVELHGSGLRAEHAQIVALELPLSLGTKRRSVLEVAQPRCHRRATSAAQVGGPRARSPPGPVAAPAPRPGAGRHLLALVAGALTAPLRVTSQGGHVVDDEALAPGADAVQRTQRRQRLDRRLTRRSAPAGQLLL